MRAKEKDDNITILPPLPPPRFIFIFLKKFNREGRNSAEATYHILGNTQFGVETGNVRQFMIRGHGPRLREPQRFLQGMQLRTQIKFFRLLPLKLAIGII